MKTKTTLPIQKWWGETPSSPIFSQPRLARSPYRFQRGFTLIELLVVIAVIGVLAALTVPVIGAIKKRAIINRARGEMAQLETAIERYKAAYGFYPPDNANIANDIVHSALTNQLYYELTGTINLANSSTPDFQTLNSTNTINYVGYYGYFGINGFMNCSRGSGEDAKPAQNFLPRINSTQIAHDEGTEILVTSVGGPFDGYNPIPGFVTSSGAYANPWRYISSHPQNNPNSYDLWVEIVFKPGVTNLICNWNNRPQLNSPLP